VRTLVPMLAEQLNIPDQPLMEKDVRLHLLLGRLTRDRRFGPHVAIRGGNVPHQVLLGLPSVQEGPRLHLGGSPDPNARSSVGTKAFRRGAQPTQLELETWYLTVAGADGYRADHPEPFRSPLSSRVEGAA
jgi:hypothetical protein